MLTKPDPNKPAWKNNPDLRRLIENGICPFCGVIIKEKDFDDELSKREYTVSGLCQGCQEMTFGTGDKED